MSGKHATSLHPRNRHQGRYDLAALSRSSPELEPHLRLNPRGEPTIDFSDAAAVRCLNQALLRQYYGIGYWNLPPGYLCPPIPGRADYIHYLADLLAQDHGGTLPRGPQIRVMDIGTGASCIYPIIGSQSYGWTFLASDIDPVSVRAARATVEANPSLQHRVTVVHQKDPKAILHGLIPRQAALHLTLCNPPFHASRADAQAGSRRKVANLRPGQTSPGPAALNFGGQAGELWCPGGELRFITRMIHESRDYASQIGWFTSLVSRHAHLRPLQRVLQNCQARQIEVIPMHQGQKTSRLIAWRF